VWNLFFVWLLIIWVGTVVKGLYNAVMPGSDRASVRWLSRAWDIFQTFIYFQF
jgi:hypothetical protein